MDISQKFAVMLRVPSTVQIGVFCVMRWMEMEPMVTSTFVVFRVMPKLVLVAVHVKVPFASILAKPKESDFNSPEVVVRPEIVTL